MKKLLLLSFVTFGFAANAQSLLTEDCSLLTVGDVGTDLTGATEGQGGWRVFATSGTALSNMAVINMAGTYGNAFQITGSETVNTATVSQTRYIYNETIADTWATRDVGNEIVQVSCDFFTGPVSTSKNTQRITLFDPTGTKFLGGMMVTMDTKVVTGLSNYNNAGTIGNYSFGMGASAAAPIVLLPNTWYTFGFSFNKTTGEVKFRAYQGSTLLFNKFVMGAAAGSDVAELDLLAAAGTANTASSVGVFDNITATATATDTLLATNSAEMVTSTIEAYPNPATDVITISSKNNEINSVVMTDINGRTVKNVNVTGTETQINISDLATGVYTMKIISNEGIATKKIIKE